MPSCLQCQTPYEVTAKDLAFYEKVSPVFNGTKYVLPPPKLCPLCRLQRRQARRNERKLYNRKCDLTGNQIISICSPDKPYPVYDTTTWWSDAFDGKKYGRDFDFNRSFFEQFSALQSEVPRLALFGKKNENSEYTNHADQLKNCYLVLNGGLAENCYYMNWIVNCKDSMDCSYSMGCELCYQVSYSNNCYNAKFVSHSDNCHDVTLLFDCKNVSNSIMCAGLRNKEHCILNQQYSKEEYENKAKELLNGTYTNLVTMQKQFTELLLKVPHQALFINNSENCNGQNIDHCKSCNQCFFLIESQDCKYCYNSLGLTDCYDVVETGMECELQIETHACNRTKRSGFCSACYDDSWLWYCDLCHNSQNIFGCVGLKNEQYCILNKQYSKEAYEELVPRIINHMIQTGEWGEFFPISFSPFAYNESLAIEYFPLTKEAVNKQGWQWHEELLGSTYQGELVSIPNDIQTIPENFIEKILTCESCQKHYRIIRQELNLYRRFNIPVPHECIECRHKKRTAENTRITIFGRNCSQCNKPLQTTYPPEAKEIIYCETCFLKITY